MDSMSAFAMGSANRGKQQKVFDWDRAAQIIGDAGANDASAGLIEDYDWTGGSIFADGAPVPADDTYVYLASTWATPTLIVDGDSHECWRMESEAPDWGAKTYWPQSALDILAGRNKKASTDS